MPCPIDCCCKLLCSCLFSPTKGRISELSVIIDSVTQMQSIELNLNGTRNISLIYDRNYTEWNTAIEACWNYWTKWQTSKLKPLVVSIAIEGGCLTFVWPWACGNVFITLHHKLIFVIKDKDLSLLLRVCW